MAVNIYFLYDGEIKYATSDGTLPDFKKLEPTSTFGCNSSEEINWMVSSLDEEIQWIKIKDKKKIAGKKPIKGSWKDTWEEKPSKVTNTHYKGTPKDDQATMDNPAVFAWDFTYKLNGGNQPVTIDPGTWVPPPPPDDDPFEND